MARILALDYGLKRTGIAVTDPMQMIASGLITVETAQLIAWLKTYCTKEPVEHIVLGIPLRADGGVTEMSQQVEEFAEKLRTAFPQLTISLFQERLSSQEAMRVMVAAGVKKQKRQEKGMTDKIAAAIILQNYMLAHVWKN